MISFTRISILSLWNRKVTSILTIFSLALSVCLFLLVDKMKDAAENGFTQSISQTDLIVGSRGGTLNLLLYTVFNMGTATNNVSWESFQELKQNEGIEWSIPYSLGDGHRGFRTVATNADFFKHYHYRGNAKIELDKGTVFDGLWDVVLGAEVAQKLNYQIGQKIVLAHGITRGETGMLQHDDKPFRVVGVMKKTGTPIDRSIYISLEGMEAIHMDWQDGAYPVKDKLIPQDHIKKEDIEIQSITSFFLRMKNRIDVLRYQRQINTFKQEPLMAIIPGVELSELWRTMAVVENVLRIISILILVIGIGSMLIALLTTLNERRREMAIFRALGASPWKLTHFLVFEAFLLSLIGICSGIILSVLFLLVSKNYLQNEYNFYFENLFISGSAAVYLLVILICGCGIGFIPAIQSKNRALKDGLTQYN